MKFSAVLFASALTLTSSVQANGYGYQPTCPGLIDYSGNCCSVYQTLDNGVCCDLPVPVVLTTTSCTLEQPTMTIAYAQVPPTASPAVKSFLSTSTSLTSNSPVTSTASSSTVSSSTSRTLTSPTSLEVLVNSSAFSFGFAGVIFSFGLAIATML